MNYEPIKKPKIYEMIIGRIKESIESGDLKPGEKLPPERDLAQLFSVSRGAVREAISVLASRGIVVVKPGIGNFLKESDNHDLQMMFDSIFQDGKGDIFELLELRQGIESYGAYYAAQRRTDEDLKRIKEAFDQMEASINKNELAVDEDFSFHAAVIEASHNSMMIHTFKLISETFLDGVYEARIDALKIPGKTEEVLGEHRRIYEAIQAADPELARQAMETHISNIKLQISQDEEV